MSETAIKELKRRFKTIFICLDNDLSLHDAIVYALDQPDIAKHVGMAARTTLCISWDSIMDSVINRYATLIKKTD